ncbi:MAG: hypothetical protein H7Z12_05665 [Rhodospirillaceae bacterium]|nr:hypothetical protein [Rhodospirillales bacterium]
MVTSTLSIRGSARTIAFYREAFNAVEVMRMDGPNGTIIQAEIPLSETAVSSRLDWAKLSAAPLEHPLTIPVDNVDASVSAAVKAGAKVLCGDTIQDPFGQVWRLTPPE